MENKEKPDKTYMLVRTDPTSSSLVARQTGGRLPDMSSPEALARLRMDASHPRYGDIPDVERQRWLANEIWWAAYYVNSSRSVDYVQTIAMSMMLDGQMMEDQYMRDLTLEEISKTFRDTIFGRYGEFYGMTAPNLFKGLDAYIHTPLKRDAAALIRRARGEGRDGGMTRNDVLHAYAASMERAMRERMEDRSNSSDNKNETVNIK